jgi:hypothetical protein
VVCVGTATDPAICSQPNKDIITFPDWSQLINCTSIDYSGNSIASLPVSNVILTLSQLSLSQNKLQTIEPYTFSGLAGSGTNIDLSNNPIVTISPFAFSGMTATGVNLALTSSDVTVVEPNAFNGVSAVIIQLIYCKALSTLPAYAFNGTVVQYSGISFATSSLTALSPNVFSGLSAEGASLQLNGNLLSTLVNGTFQGITVTR